MQGVTITYDGFLLGDGSNFYISYLNPGSLPIRQADQRAAGRDGGFIFNQNYDFREIELDVNIFSGSVSTFFTDIRALRAAFQRTNTPKELVINYWDGSIRKIDVFPTILPNPEHRPGNVDKADFSVRLTAAFPFYKGGDEDVIEETLYLTDSLGFDYPVDYPFDYQSGVAVNSYIFDNDGDVDALVKIVFNGSAINPTLTNTSAGNMVQIGTTLTGSVSVTLEYTPSGRNISDQDGNSYEQYFNGSTAFFFVPRGSNTFVFSAATYDVNASCDLTFTKYYLS